MEENTWNKEKELALSVTITAQRERRFVPEDKPISVRSNPGSTRHLMVGENGRQRHRRKGPRAVAEKFHLLFVIGFQPIV